MGKRIVFLLLFIGLLSFLITSSHAAQTDFPACSAFGVQRFQEKKAAHPFSLKMLDGKQVSLGDFKGKPVLFLFWASWCESCRDEIGHIEKFSQGKKDPLPIVLVAIDGENEKRIQRIIKEKKITLPVLLDVKEKTARAFGVRMVPTVFLINPEGNTAGMIVGPRDWNSPEAWSSIKELFGLQ